ncbi:MAG TPA: prolyl oligopeptidase family serine peptidase [Kofleriaceae bacterium]
MKSALLLVALLPVSASASTFTLENVMSAPFCDGLVAAERAPRIAWTVNLRGERNVWVAEAPAWRPHAVTHYRGDTGLTLAALAISPDGKVVVFTRGGEGERTPNPASLLRPPRRQVFAAATDGSSDPRALGDGGDELQLSPDGSKVAWVAKKQLWIAPVDGSAPARAVTELEGEVHEPRWSPDGKRLAFSVDRKSHALIAVVDLAGEALRWIAPSTDRAASPRWSPDGQKLAFVRAAGFERKLPIIPMRPQPWSVWLADAQTGKGRAVWNSGGAARDSEPASFEANLLFFAGERVVFASEQDGRLHLYSVGAAGAARRLTTGDYDVEQAHPAPDRRTILFTSNQDDADRRHAWRVPADGSSAPQPVTRGDGIETAPVQAADGTIFVLAATARQPILPARVRGTTPEVIARELVPPEFPERELVVPTPVTFRAADGLTVHGQLFAPPSCKSGCPAVVFSHGGPIRQMLPAWHYLDYYANAYAENQFLTNQGIVVLSVNYRLGIMYGRDFREPPNAGWRGSAEYQDVLAAAGYLASLPQVDRKRIGLWGGSYGGFLTALGLARSSDVFKAGVDFHGVHDWSVFLERWEQAFPDVPDKKEALDLAFKSSPVADVARWRSPVLFIHGDDDRNVPFDQTTDLSQRLRHQGVRVEEIVYPDEIHDLLLWRSWVDAYRATAAFFAREL